VCCQSASRCSHSKLLDTRLLIDDADKPKVAGGSTTCFELCDGFVSLRARCARNPSPKPRKPRSCHLRKYPPEEPTGHCHQPVVSALAVASPTLPPTCTQTEQIANLWPAHQGREPCAATAPAGNHDRGTCVAHPEPCPAKNRPDDGPAGQKIGLATVLP
jgi:hypothetical protein